MYIHIYIYIYTHTCNIMPWWFASKGPGSSGKGRNSRTAGRAPPKSFSGPETGKRKQVTRKADGKLTLLENLEGSWHEKLTLLVTHFSLPISVPPKVLLELVRRKVLRQLLEVPHEVDLCFVHNFKHVFTFFDARTTNVSMAPAQG